MDIKYIHEPEIFVPIIGFENLYTISNYGNVFSLSSNKMLQNINRPDGYLEITLCKNGGVTHFLIHRLVALHFIPNPNNYPIINHIDGNKQNNYYMNLEWCTSYYNNMHSMHVLGKNTTSKLSELEILEIYKLAHEEQIEEKEIAKMYNISREHASKIKLGRRHNDITHHMKVCPVRFLTMENNNNDTYEYVGQMKGEQHRFSKLTEEQVIEIYKLAHYGELTQRQISEKYNIVQQTVADIKNGKSWKHVTENIKL